MTFPPFTDEHEAFRKTVRTFAEREIAPHSQEWDEAGTFPREIFKKAGDLGLLGVRMDPIWGGSGLDYWYTACLCEELVHSRSFGVNFALLVQGEIATQFFALHGSDELKKEFLTPALHGERIAAVGITEPDAGSDVANIRTTARRVGNEYVINGSKMWLTNGTRADFLSLAVRTGDPGFGGISMVAFPTDVKGYQVSKKMKKVGNHASDTAAVYFEDCRIPARYLLGEENFGFYYVMSGVQAERLATALISVAAMERMIEQAIRYGNERQVFGQPLSSFQVWEHKFAEHATAIEAARWLTYRAVDLFARGENAVKEISMAKLFAGDLAQRVAYDCMQIHGGMGYVLETEIARTWCDVRMIPIAGGASEIMKMLISKMMGVDRS